MNKGIAVNRRPRNAAGIGIAGFRSLRRLPVHPPYRPRLSQNSRSMYPPAH